MKKVISLVLSLLIVLGVCGMPVAFADSSEPIYDGEIVDYDTKTVTIANEGEIHYFTFTPIGSGLYAFFSISEFDTVGDILDSDGNVIAHNDDGYSVAGCSNNFCVYYNLESGKTYRMQCKAYSRNVTGSFDVRVMSWNSQFQSYLTAGNEVSVTIPQNTLYSYCFIPEEDGSYYFVFSGGDVYSIDIYDDDIFINSYMIDKGYADCELKKDQIYYLYIHGSVNNAENTLNVFKEVIVDDGYLNYEIHKTVTYEHPYEKHIVHYVPEVDSLYLFRYVGDFALDSLYYLDNNNNKQYPPYFANFIRDLKTGTEYIIETYLSSDKITGSGEVWMENKLYSGGELTVGETVTAMITRDYDIVQYSFAPSESGVYALSSAQIGEEYFDTYATLHDDSFAQLSADDDSGGDRQFKLSYYLEAGKTYYYRVRNYNYNTGSFKVTLENVTSTHEHSFYDYGTVSPTCTEQGYTVYKCDGCGFTKNDDYVAANGHTMTHYTATYPTCTEMGTEHYYCYYCDYNYDENIPANGHTMTHYTATYPTCTEMGTEHYYCSYCDYYYDEDIPASGHTMNHYTSAEPSCTEKGTEHYYCSNCDYNYDEDIPANGHSYSESSRTAPTCTEEGKITYTCSECHDSYDESINALGHSFTNYIYNNDATPEKDGTETAKCDRCDETDTRVKAGTRINPTASARINAEAQKEVDYRANVTVNATADNVPEGYVLAIYEGNTQFAKGDNKKVSYPVGEMKSSRTFTVKVIDSNGNVQKDAGGNDLAVNSEVKVNTGFFAKLVAFFRGLFRSLPNVTVGPKF